MMSQITSLNLTDELYKRKQSSNKSYTELIEYGLAAVEIKKQNDILQAKMIELDTNELELRRKIENLTSHLDRSLRELEALKDGRAFIDEEIRA